MSKSQFSPRWSTVLMTALVGALLFGAGRGPTGLVLIVAVWLVASVAADALWHRAIDEVTPLTMAPAAHLAAIAVLPVSFGVPVVAVSALIGAAVWRRATFLRVLTQALAATLGAAGALAVVLLGQAHVFGDLVTDSASRFHPRHFLVIAVAGIVYLAIQQTLVSLCVSRIRHCSASRVWGEVFGRKTELVTSGALVTVGILAVFCFVALGYRGLLLCVMPLLFVRDGSRRNLELESAQGLLIKNERLAAKGEMAAEIGHELNNYLAAISGRAQLVLRQIGDGKPAPLVTEAERVRTLATEMGEMAKGLMDFSHREVKRTSFGINELIERTVDFVRPQTRFRSWEFALESDPQVPQVRIDPGQIQQMLLILLGRVADGGAVSAAGYRMRIRTFRDDPHRSVGIEISSGSRSRTGEDGDEQTLETVRRIVDRHRGQFLVEGGDTGETYRVLLPAA